MGNLESPHQPTPSLHVFRMWSKPTQTRGEHVNSAQKRLDSDSEPSCCEVTALTTVPNVGWKPCRTTTHLSNTATTE